MGDRNLTFWNSEPNRFFVACPRSLPETVLGCIAYKDIGCGTVEINRLSVDRNARGLGVARQLIERAMATARKCGYSKVYIDCTNGQESAIRLYRRMGFKESVGLYQRQGVKLLLHGIHRYEFRKNL